MVKSDNKEIICAYLWQDVIRLGFSPSSTKDQKSWLLQYGKSLRSFWEVGDYPEPPSNSKRKGVFSATIDSASIGMSFEYVIENSNKFIVRLLSSNGERGLMWIHDMDGKYFSFPNQALLTKRNLRKQAIKDMNCDDISMVIDSLILHPTPHQHIESPLDNHEIRIGGGLLNPFLYLFHLRVQLCPDEDRRMAEKDRLIKLFENAIKNNSAIPPGKLMEIPN